MKLMLVLSLFFAASIPFSAIAQNRREPLPICKVESYYRPEYRTDDCDPAGQCIQVVPAVSGVTVSVDGRTVNSYSGSFEIGGNAHRKALGLAEELKWAGICKVIIDNVGNL